MQHAATHQHTTTQQHMHNSPTSCCIHSYHEFITPPLKSTRRGRFNIIDAGKDKETLQAAIDTLKGNYEKILTSPSIRPLVLDLNFESTGISLHVFILFPL